MALDIDDIRRNPSMWNGLGDLGRLTRKQLEQRATKLAARLERRGAEAPAAKVARWQEKLAATAQKIQTRAATKAQQEAQRQARVVEREARKVERRARRAPAEVLPVDEGLPDAIGPAPVYDEGAYYQYPAAPAPEAFAPPGEAVAAPSAIGDFIQRNGLVLVIAAVVLGYLFLSRKDRG